MPGFRDVELAQVRPTQRSPRERLLDDLLCRMEEVSCDQKQVPEQSPDRGRIEPLRPGPFDVRAGRLFGGAYDRLAHPLVQQAPTREARGPYGTLAACSGGHSQSHSTGHN
jgi:hypothetical protein